MWKEYSYENDNVVAYFWHGKMFKMDYEGKVIKQSVKSHFYFLLLWLHLWRMEAPRLGVESELQLTAYTTATATHDPSRIQDLHCSFRKAGSLIHWGGRDWTCILTETTSDPCHAEPQWGLHFYFSDYVYAYKNLEGFTKMSTVISYDWQGNRWFSFYLCLLFIF